MEWRALCRELAASKPTNCQHPFRLCLGQLVGSSGAVCHSAVKIENRIISNLQGATRPVTVSKPGDAFWRLSHSRVLIQCLIFHLVNLDFPCPIISASGAESLNSLISDASLHLSCSYLLPVSWQRIADHFGVVKLFPRGSVVSPAHRQPLTRPPLHLGVCK